MSECVLIERETYQLILSSFSSKKKVENLVVYSSNFENISHFAPKNTCQHLDTVLLLAIGF